MTSPAQRCETPGRLISLWEIMEHFNPALFIASGKTLGVFTSNKAIMPSESINQEAKTGIDNRAIYDKTLANTETDCDELELVASLDTVRNMRKLLTEPECTYGQLGDFADELYGRLIAETKGRFFFQLSVRETEYYSKPWKNWEEIVSRFPETLGDIEEASKCFALSRYAAAIFHSIQVIETGLIELGTFIGVIDPKSGFTAVEKRLTKILTTQYAILTEFERAHYDFLEQIQGTVAAVKNAWRNKISHAQGRLVLMTADFSPAIAEEILIATRAFMGRLADGLPARRRP